MNWRKLVIPGILFSIGIFNFLIAMLFPGYKVHGMLFAFSAIFIFLALVSYICGRQKIVKEGTITELLPHVVFDLPQDSNFKDLTMERSSSRTELSGTYQVAGEAVGVEITHIWREHLSSEYKRSENPGEKLLRDIRDEDEQTRHIKNLKKYTNLKVNGEPITAYTALVKGRKEDRPVLRGMADLGDLGILLISVAAYSRRGLEETVDYLATMRT